MQLTEWKAKLIAKKQAEAQAEIDRVKAAEAAKEARWIGVPAWKRKVCTYHSQTIPQYSCIPQIIEEKGM